MVSSPRWEFFDGPDSSKSKIAKELKQAHLSRDDAIRLDELMDRVAAGRGIPGRDFKHLKAEGLWEIRLRTGKRNLRLLYSPETGDSLVFVALILVPKKSPKLSSNVFETARKRLASWREKQQTETRYH